MVSASCSQSLSRVTVSAEVQLPVKRMVVEGETPGLSLATRPDDPNYNPEKFLGEVKIGFLPGIEERSNPLNVPVVAPPYE